MDGHESVYEQTRCRTNDRIDGLTDRRINRVITIEYWQNCGGLFFFKKNTPKCLLAESNS